MKASKFKPAPDAVADATQRGWWPYGAGLLIAFVAVFVVFGPALNGPFLLDDTYLPYVQPAFANAPVSAWIAGTRPLLMFSYWLNFQAAGSEPGPYHVTNVLLHLLNGFLIWLAVRKILTLSAVAEREIYSAFAAGLFLIHPLQTESVAYIASRSEAQSVFFFLAAFVLFLYRRSVSVSWGIATAVLVLFSAACLTKEHAAVLPVLLLLTDYFWNPGFSFQGIRRNWKLYIPIVAGGAVAVVFVARVLSASTSAGFGMKDLPWYQYFYTQCRAIWRYVLFYIWPVGQNIDHDYPISRTLFDYGAVVGLIGLVLLIGAAWWWRKRCPLISYGVFTYLLLLSPTSSFVPIRDTLIERRMYLPFIGLLLVTIGLLQWWKASRSTLVMVLSAVLLVEAGLAYSRNQLWGDAISMWADSVEKSPSKVRPRFQLAAAYYSTTRCADAADQFARTAKLEPPSAALLVDWALAADCAGNANEALIRLQQALALGPTAHIYTEIAREYAKLNQFPQALDSLDAAAKVDPNYVMIYAYRGRIHAMRGDKAGAAADYQHALQIDPQNQLASQGLSELSRRP